jgi:hypothetical protein
MIEKSKTTKYMKKLLAIFLFLPLLASATTGRVSINLTAGVSLEETQMLYFSNVTITGAGTVLMTPSGLRSATGDVQFNDEYNSPARFSINGANNATYKVSFGQAVSLTNGKYNITASDFKTSLVNNVGTLDATGKGSFSVGCTLTCPNGITSGNYSGTYEIQCSYE